eukprot:4823500-Amphidinium_carterae.2
MARQVTMSVMIGISHGVREWLRQPLQQQVVMLPVACARFKCRASIRVSQCSYSCCLNWLQVRSVQTAV